MKTHVVVGVKVVQTESGFLEGVKLRTDFRFQLPSHGLPEEETDSGKDKTRRKLAFLVHQTEYFLDGEQGNPSTSKRWSPTFNPGSLLARSTASSAALAPTIFFTRVSPEGSHLILS